ncbi:MAG: cupin domain-containing protein [Myxococcales bacterium]|nr:cupin domain-containing protein [Myxococcales bacterium]MCB9524096.1 cupin domain-containing protein [Myxococcales bacterium]
MRAYWLNEGPSAAIDEAFLASQGVTYERLPLDPAAYQGPLDALKAANGYIEQDIVQLAPDTPNLDAICAKFDKEHTHDDDEVRFVLEGEGIFDIRTTDDRMMRVVVEAGDLIVVPADRHHLFLLTEKKHIRCVRLFQDAAGWVPHYRAA